MNQEGLDIGDPIAASPVGAGKLTGFSQRGFPQVNHITVVWCERTDGALFDPSGRVGGSHGPIAAAVNRHLD